MTEQFKPFDNDTQSTTLFADNGQGITFENKTNGGLIIQITIPINLKYV